MAVLFPIGNILLDANGPERYIPDREYWVFIAMPATIDVTNLTSARALGGAVRAARIAMGLRQAEAALLCGVGVRFLSDLENGKETVRLGAALKVVNGLGLSLMLGPKKPFWTK